LQSNTLKLRIRERERERELQLKQCYNGRIDASERTVNFILRKSDVIIERNNLKKVKILQTCKKKDLVYAPDGRMDRISK
jgi:uncharacterized protein YjbK